MILSRTGNRNAFSWKIAAFEVDYFETRLIILKRASKFNTKTQLLMGCLLFTLGLGVASADSATKQDAILTVTVTISNHCDISTRPEEVSSKLSSRISFSCSHGSSPKVLSFDDKNYFDSTNTKFNYESSSSNEAVALVYF